MDIHKPKPWHGLREFLKEYLIIVVGVLTALGGEQAVEWVHRQHEVSETRESLRDEMAGNATALKRDLEEAPCVKARLDRIAAWADGGPPPQWSAGGAGVMLRSSAWDEAKSGAVSHMPLKERLSWDELYAAVADRNETSRVYRASLSQLARYMASPQVPAEERIRAKEDVAHAEMQAYLVTNFDRPMIQMARSMGAIPHPYQRQTVVAMAELCGRTPSSGSGPAAK